MKSREFFGNAAYNTTGKEMDRDYPRCTHCRACSATCMYYKHLAVLTDEEWDEYYNVAWCTEVRLSEGR